MIQISRAILRGALACTAGALAWSMPVPAATAGVRTGADILVAERSDLVRGKRIGVVCNHTARLSDGRHLVDALVAIPGVKLTALFGPEHGVRGDTTGAMSDGVDRATGVPVYSLYGSTYAPTTAMLRDIDILIFDVQDVGARFYTYISTLGHVMSAAARAGIPVLVLDRPNPIGGVAVEGPLAVDSLLSFVAYATIPIRHGMTVGEIAGMYNGEGWLDGGVKATLTVVAMEGWTRETWYDSTGLNWSRPSPNMPTLRAATVYPGTCLFEGVNVSEGRGTDRPFEYIGAPWLDPGAVIERFRSEKVPGADLTAVSFTPRRRPNNATGPDYEGEECRGVFLDVVDRDAFEPVRAGVALLRAIHHAHPDRLAFRERTFDRLAGTRTVRTMIIQGVPLDTIVASWAEGIRDFDGRRSKYLLYR